MPFPYLSCFFPSVFWIPWYILFETFRLRRQIDPGWTPLLVLTFLGGCGVCVCASAWMQDLFQVTLSASKQRLCCDDSLYIFSDFHLGIWNCFAEIECDCLLTCLCSYTFIYVCVCVERALIHTEITSSTAKIRQWGSGEQQQNLASWYSYRNSIWIFPK